MTDTTARVDASRDKLKELSLKAGKGASKLGDESLTPDEQKQRFHDLCEQLPPDEAEGARRSGQAGSGPRN